MSDVRPGIAHLAIGERNDLAVLRPGVLTAWANKPAALQLLLDVGHVARGARGREDAAEQVPRDAQGVIQASRVVVDVWIEAQPFGCHQPYGLLNFGNRAFATYLGDFAGQLLQDPGAGIPGLVDR